MQLVHFIFSDPFIFLGFCCILFICFNAIYEIIKLLKKK